TGVRGERGGGQRPRRAAGPNHHEHTFAAVLLRHGPPSGGPGRRARIRAARVSGHADSARHRVRAAGTGTRGEGGSMKRKVIPIVILWVVPAARVCTSH